MVHTHTHTQNSPSPPLEVILKSSPSTHHVIHHELAHATNPPHLRILFKALPQSTEHPGAFLLASSLLPLSPGKSRLGFWGLIDLTPAPVFRGCILRDAMVLLSCPSCLQWGLSGGCLGLASAWHRRSLFTYSEKSASFSLILDEMRLLPLRIPFP